MAPGGPAKAFSVCLAALGHPLLPRPFVGSSFTDRKLVTQLAQPGAILEELVLPAAAGGTRAQVRGEQR
jgi:hypothetical protein